MRLLVIGAINSGVAKAIDLAKQRDAKVAVVENQEDALNFLRDGKGADLVLADAKSEIKNLVDSMLVEHISTPVIAYGIDVSPKDAVFAIKSGAKEFLPLPPDETLIAAIFAAISDNQKKAIFVSQKMQDIFNIAEKVAKSDANILITGKSGTGKEVMAKYIHTNSNRSAKAFVKVNCAAIPENLLESELFGHEKGAFTGALARRVGKFEESSGGTLLLDEISEMDIKLQAKLLRAIQEREIDRVGGTSPVKVDLRIIATSNRNLLECISKGTFREDLYFRLNIINIELPKLSERKCDILPLTKAFIEKYSKSNKIKVKGISKEAEEKIMNHTWPGNVRELENTIHRTILLASGDNIEASDIHIQKEYFAKKKISEAEKELVIDTLSYCLGDLNNAAEILGISISSLKEKLEAYDKKP